MKKLILFFLLSSFVTTSFAQKQSYQEKKATENTKHITVKMNLNNEQNVFLHSVLLNKYKNTATQINGKDLSKEEKQEVYKKSYKNTTTKLLEKFSKDEVKEIFSLLKELNKK